MSRVSTAERSKMTLAGALMVPAVAAVLGLVAWLPMTWQQQLVFGTAVVVASLFVSRISSARETTYFLVLVSVCVTLRYAWFRISTYYHYLHDPWSTPDRLDAAFMAVLLAAELYSFAILMLGHMQGIAPLHRKPEPMPKNVSEWPSVDVFIPTYNEPLPLVQTTAFAAMAMDWPADRLRVFILDDGEREEFRQFAQSAGIGYIARTEHEHAKAGNINHALDLSGGDYVAIFDADHVPTRSFLQMTVGWFLRDPKLGMVQTPHHFYSPDPVERNLNHFRVVPNEGELFYGVIQDGNDLWNATFFCGSCAVLRRKTLEETGGIAVETVTEDAHTSLRMQMRGWNTAYLNTVQAAGLATESVAGHVKQRTRWARGMTQILRTDNPLFARGLRPAQRLCYLNAMLHFMYAAPRLIFLASPLLYLILGKRNMPGYWVAILVFAAPHLILATITNSRIQGHKRHTFWNEVYETILSPYILFPTWLTLINPRYGKFNVTTKGSQQDDHFDGRIAWPFLTMLGLNVFGLALAVPRYLFWNVEHRGTVLMNVFWTLFNIVILGATVAVCRERRQRRSAVRIAARIPVKVTANGSTESAFSEDVSSTGMALALAGKWAKDQEFLVSFDEVANVAPIRVRVAEQSGKLVRVQFQNLSLEEQFTVTRVIYSRADRWLDWNEGRKDDQLLLSLLRVLGASIRGLVITLALPFGVGSKGARDGKAVLVSAKTRAAALLLASVLLLPLLALGKPTAATTGQTSGTEIEDVRYPVTGSSRGAGILLNMQMPQQLTRIVLPSTLLVEHSDLTVHYTFPADSRPDEVTIRVTLNGNVIATLTPTTSELAAGESRITLPLPVDVFVQDSRLGFELTGASQAACRSRSSGAGGSWVRIDASSGIDVRGRRLAIADDLSLLPEPFVRRGVGAESAVPFIFAKDPDLEMLRAAGIAASWFGVQAQDRAPRFEPRVGTMPRGNAVLFLTESEQVGAVTAEAIPSVRIEPNPTDSFGKLLVFSAPSEQELVRFVQSFSAGKVKLEGSVSKTSRLDLPPARGVDDAPAWVQGSRVELSTIAGAESLRSSANDDSLLYLRLAPDLNFGARNDAYVSLRYRAEGSALAPSSNISVALNGIKANSVPLQSGSLGSEQIANIPLGDLPFFFRNTLTTRLYPVGQNADPCAAVPSEFKGSISGKSYLDLGEATHLARLPNLRMFSNAGFPFTRYADLGETVVLLPQQGETAAASIYLDLMGYFGAQTGFPALRVTVAPAAEASQYAEKDQLFIGTYGDAIAAANTVSNLSLQPWNDGSVLSPRARWVLQLEKLVGVASKHSMSLQSDGGAAQGVIEGSQSPFDSGHSLVLISAKTVEDLTSMSSAMFDAMPLDDIRGRVSLFNGGGFQSYELSGEEYLVGTASLPQRLVFWMAIHPWIQAVVLLVVCGIAGIWIQSWVVYRRRLRLEGLTHKQPIGAQ